MMVVVWTSVLIDASVSAVVVRASALIDVSVSEVVVWTMC